jgi:uncharacterized membrane protein (UPF0127 family)
MMVFARFFVILLVVFCCLPTAPFALDKQPVNQTVKPIQVDKSANIEKVFTNDLSAPNDTKNILKSNDNKPMQKLERPASTTIFYSKDKLRIHRKITPKPATPLMPWQVAEDAVDIDVEIRDGMSLYSQNDWFNLASYSEKEAVMMAFSEPAIQPIVNSAQYAPVDILFVDKQGKITQIVPSILLSDLEKDIIPDEPILAFLFLKGGACAELSINAGDDVEYSMFKKPPRILNAPKTDPAGQQ